MVVQPSQAGGYFAVATNASGAATSQVATLTVRPTRGVIGYYTDYNISSTGMVHSIEIAAFTPVRIEDISTFDFSRLNLLMIDEINENSSSELRLRLPTIQEWVNKGGRLIVHQRNLDLSTAAPNPFLFGLRSTTFQYWNGNDINIISPANNPVATGPHGTLGDTSLDGGGYYYNVVALGSTLPFSATPLLSASTDRNQVLAFAYGLGNGLVYYSSIALDYYLDNSGFPPGSIIRDVYVPNVIEYAATFTGSGSPVIYSNPSSLEITAGSTATFFVSASGKTPL